LNANISVDVLDIKKKNHDPELIKKSYLNPDSSKSSSFHSEIRAGEEVVCRICLGNEAEGTPGEDG
jgi:hypothetical protein